MLLHESYQSLATKFSRHGKLVEEKRQHGQLKIVEGERFVYSEVLRTSFVRRDHYELITTDYAKHRRRLDRISADDGVGMIVIL